MNGNEFESELTYYGNSIRDFTLQRVAGTRLGQCVVSVVERPPTRRGRFPLRSSSENTGQTARSQNCRGTAVFAG